MTSRNLLAASVGCAVLGACGLAQAAPISITNGDFSGAPIAGSPGWAAGVPSGWTSNEGAGGTDPSNYGPGATAPYTYNWGGTNQCAWLQDWNAYITLEQTLVNIAPDTQYDFSIKAGDFGVASNATYTFQLLEGSTPRITLTGTVSDLDRMSLGGTTLSGSYTTGATVSGDPLAIKLKLEGSNTAHYLEIDDVALNATVVPEPVSLGLLSLGAVGILARRQDRKRGQRQNS